MKGIIIFIIFAIFIQYNHLLSNIDVINLGIIKLQNKDIKCKDSNREEAVYKIITAKIVKVLKSHKIKYKIRYGLVETNWYNYQNKSSKLYITIMSDECQIRIQLQQKELDNNKLSKINPQTIMSDLNQILKE